MSNWKIRYDNHKEKKKLVERIAELEAHNKKLIMDYTTLRDCIIIMGQIINLEKPRFIDRMGAIKIMIETLIKTNREADDRRQND